MKIFAATLYTLLLSSVLLFAQTTTTPGRRPGGSTPAPNQTVNPAPQSGVIRILTPVAGKATTADSVTLRFQLVNPAADAGEPNYVIQMDGQEPITTSSTEQTFTGLAPGTHTITVTLVDANGTPITGGRSSVQFQVKAAGATTGGMAYFAPKIKEPLRLAAASPGSLPVLSAVGFGVLVGGSLSLRKTRQRQR